MRADDKNAVSVPVRRPIYCHKHTSQAQVGTHKEGPMSQSQAYSPYRQYGCSGENGCSGEMGMGLNAPIGLTSPTSRPGRPPGSSASMASKSSSLGGGLDPGGSADGKPPDEPAAPAELAAAPPPDVSSSDRCRESPVAPVRTRLIRRANAELGPDGGRGRPSFISLTGGNGGRLASADAG